MLRFEQKALGLTRIAMGFIFFWAFIDKLFGLGFATKPESSWLAGGSPTAGFLGHATHGPLASIFQNMAGQGWVDWLFMIGLLGIGLALLLGIGMRIAGYAGALLVLLMWSAALPPANNPLLDEHVVYAFLFLAFTHMDAGKWFGLGNWWKRTSLVRQYPVLE